MKTVIEIEGMKCPMCEAHVQEALRGVADVQKVKASHKKKRAEVKSDAPLDEAALRAAVEGAGYEVIAITAA